MSELIAVNPDSPEYKKTIRFTIPDFDEFGELLHDRLHGLLYYIEEMQYKFSLITNYFDRDENRILRLQTDNEDDRERLVYGGTRTQRFLLEKNLPAHIADPEDQASIKSWRLDRNHNWRQLRNRPILRDTPGFETFGFFDEFRQGLLALEAVKPGSLQVYFSELNNDFRRNEFPIFKDYFNLDQDLYIGIPLLGMGLFQGIVWIIFDHRERNKFDTPDTVKRLIKLFQINYDNLLLDWDTVGQNIKRKSVVAEAKGVIFETNPIQQSCGLKKYYEIQDNYLNKRIERNEQVIGARIKPLKRMAIITILLDSFAHNISAHSLTALSWWFQERAEYLENPDVEEKLRMEQLGQDKNPLILLSKLYPQKTLSRELYPLFKFLLEKGAFWSGITRQTNFTGKSSTLFSILWYDFVNNPLYLGTIANTEEVSKLHIHLTIYTEEEPLSDSQFLNTKYVKIDSEGKLLDGVFATIDLEDFKKQIEEQKEKHKNPSNADKEQIVESIFIQKNADLFESFKRELVQLRAFFPGGVVGKHAFFTLLENEIRNVKHYKDEALKDIQQNGLTLNISIHERPIDSNSKTTSEDQLLKIGVWLKHPVKMTSDLLLRRIEGLEKDIITEDTDQPQLGGNYQDKICAAMLQTSSFDLVQDNDSSLGKIYYPWIKTASSRTTDHPKDHVQDFEVSYRKYTQRSQDEFKQLFKPQEGPGYLKKYFHLWKSADILTLDSAEGLQTELENLARFRFLVLPPTNESLYNQYKGEGIIRVLHRKQTPISIAEAYQQWLPKWLKSNNGNQNIIFTFWYGKTRTGRVIYLDGRCLYQNYQELRQFKSSDSQFQAIQNISQQIDLHAIHRGKNIMDQPLLSYRSHGELMSRFYGGKTIQSVSTLSNDELGELLEVLATRICIFDRRTYSRLYPEDTNAGVDVSHVELISNVKAIQRDRLELFRDKLFLDFRNESLKEFEQIKNLGFQYFHFVVLHLSFIEGMPDGSGNNSTYSEDRIIDFIDEQILQGADPDTIGDDFILVITTGRGRMQWWDKVKANSAYARFVTFRPIESILSVVEDAQQIHDDFDMKHNMVKLLFGS